MRIYAHESSNNIPKSTDIDRDTLIVDGKIYLLKYSFIKSFDGYRKLFKDNEVNILAIPETKGYKVTWVVKKRILYIDHVWLANGKGFGSTKKGEKPHDIIKDSVPLTEIHRRLEELTGRKFNSKGLLKADWVTGEVKAEANGHYVSFIDSSTYKSDDHYNFTFDEGKLKKIVKL